MSQKQCAKQNADDHIQTGRVGNLLLARADMDGRNLAGQMLTSLKRVKER
jgi:hypothetical protein